MEFRMMSEELMGDVKATALTMGEWQTVVDTLVTKMEDYRNMMGSTSSEDTVWAQQMYREVKDIIHQIQEHTGFEWVDTSEVDGKVLEAGKLDTLEQLDAVWVTYKEDLIREGREDEATDVGSFLDVMWTWELTSGVYRLDNIRLVKQFLEKHGESAERTQEILHDLVQVL